MVHLDLFSGIGGFALAVDTVWPGSTHIFCDNDLFCQEVLKKHWPGSEIYGDIRSFIANAPNRRWREAKRLAVEKGYQTKSKFLRDLERRLERPYCDLVTGGFPCQPFSQAGRRRGTADDRYLWPEMLRVIQLTKPTWVIGENVGGFVTWNEGMVLEQVCLDLESEGYEVQPFIIPAVSVNAPHRRDRVWIVAHKLNPGLQGSQSNKAEGHNRQSDRSGGDQTQNMDAQDTISQRGGGGMESGRQILGSESTQIEDARPSWEENWIEVATRLCRVDDGVSRRVDRLKALGNAIVPQVAEEIMKAIKLSNPDQPAGLHGEPNARL